MHPILDPLFLALAVPAILCVGFARGGLTAAGGVAVPLLALAVPPSDAAGIVLPLLCFADLFGMWTYRQTWSRRLLPRLLAGALVGIGLGFASFGLLDDNAVRILIGVIAVAFTLRYWLRRRIAVFADGSAPGPRAGMLWSCLSGYTSFLAHAGGPPLMVYLLPLKLGRETFTGTAVMFFGAVNLAKLGPYAWLGLLDGRNLSTSLMLAPIALAGVRIGAWATRALDDAAFYRLSYALTFLAGSKLIWDGSAHFLGG